MDENKRDKDESRLVIRRPGGQGKDYKNSKERLYDKLPFTYKQVDIFVKVFFVLIVLLVIWAVANGSGA